MLLYKVEWIHDSALSKGNGRVTKDEKCFLFTVLCNSSQDAHACLLYYFRYIFVNRHSLSINDGEIRMSRLTIDSRCFHPQYLFLSGMREPINLVDVKSNILRATKIFGLI